MARLQSLYRAGLAPTPAAPARTPGYLPPKVLTAESYRNLTNLLFDSVTAKFLHHTGSITEQIINGLHRLPAALRSVAIMAMFNRVDGMYWFADGLRFLASRTGLPFDTLAKQIGALDQPDQIAAKIRQHVEDFPLPATLPPGETGGFRRLDTVAEMSSPKIGETVWPTTSSMLMTAHPPSI